MRVRHGTRLKKAKYFVDLRQAIALGKAEYAEIEGFLVDLLDDADERIEGQNILFDLTEERSSHMKHPTVLFRSAQIGRSCLRFLLAVGQKLKPRGRD
jgi:hypothetical protein